MAKTKDGYTVTTVEQEGSNAGEEVGRVTLIRENGYSYWGVGSVKKAQELTKLAPTMTHDEFERMMESR